MAAVWSAFRDTEAGIREENFVPMNRPSRVDRKKLHALYDETVVEWDCESSCLAKTQGGEAGYGCVCEKDRLELRNIDNGTPMTGDDPVALPPHPTPSAEEGSPIITTFTRYDGSVITSIISWDPHHHHETTSPSADATTIPTTSPSPYLISLTSTPTTTSTANTSLESETEASSSSSSGGGLSETAKIGLGVGLGVGLAVLIALLAICILFRRRRRNHTSTGARYMPQASEPSMVEAPRPIPGEQARHSEDVYEQSRREQYAEVPRDSRQFQAFGPVSPPPEYDIFQTPVSAMTSSEPRFPVNRQAAPEPLPVLTIPSQSEEPRGVREEASERGVSPISSNVSPVSAMSPAGSRPPSPRHDQ